MKDGQAHAEAHDRDTYLRTKKTERPLFEERVERRKTWLRMPSSLGRFGGLRALTSVFLQSPATANRSQLRNGDALRAFASIYTCVPRISSADEAFVSTCCIVRFLPSFLRCALPMICYFLSQPLGLPAGGNDLRLFPQASPNKLHCNVRHPFVRMNPLANQEDGVAFGSQ